MLLKLGSRDALVVAQMVKDIMADFCFCGSPVHLLPSSIFPFCLTLNFGLSV